MIYQIFSVDATGNIRSISVLSMALLRKKAQAMEERKLGHIHPNSLPLLLSIIAGGAPLHLSKVRPAHKPASQDLYGKIHHQTMTCANQHTFRPGEDSIYNLMNSLN